MDLSVPEFPRHDALPKEAKSSPPSLDASALTLVVEREGGAPSGRTISWEGDRCRIGSHPGNDVVLADPSVARIHCELFLEGQTWRVRDASGTGGITLDSVRVRDAELHRRSTLEIGASTLRVHVGAPAGVDVGQSTPEDPSAPSAFGNVAGRSPPMRRLFELLEKIGGSDINVLIEGESGTGKELVATEIVRRSVRANKPFVIVDCGAVSASLFESELFGHARGAFTGADRDRMGAFEAANGGTVFLDEIGELPLDLQPKLLRALEAREIRRVGDSKVRRIDVRVISATNRELEREVERGRFREDLYFRLAVIRARLPALRERKEDIPLLVRAFLSQFGASDGVGGDRLFEADVLAEMALHDWPGNVRELRNHVERSLVLRTSTPPSAPDSGSVASSSDGTVVPFRIAKEGIIEAFERSYLSKLLEAAKGNMSRAARMAGMDRMYLHRLTQKHGLRKNRKDGADPADGND